MVPSWDQFQFQFDLKVSPDHKIYLTCNKKEIGKNKIQAKLLKNFFYIL